MSPIDISLKLADQSPIAPPTQGFFYVDQGNYQTFVLADTPLTAYSDSATSCIITAVVSNFDDRNSRPWPTSTALPASTPSST